MPEIDGLRGVALLLVVFFHLFGHGRVSGGVDVFLFVSGVVLAISLRASVRRGEQFRIGRRWARTFGRLAPPAAIVLVAVVVASATVLPPWSQTQTLWEVGASALYVENWALILSQLSYGAAGPETSPVQHFWSLSIQGQLFLVVPAVFALGYGLRGLLRRPGAALFILLSVASVASFSYATYLNSVDPNVAYFDTFARVWEFGAGMIVGTMISHGITLRSSLGTWLAWLGLAVILGSGFLIDGARGYPGPLALVPVVAAALIVLNAGSVQRFAVGRALRASPFAALAKISYPLYLWHWPVLIVYLALVDNEAATVGALGAGVVLLISGALAWLTWRLLDHPMSTFVRHRAGWRSALPSTVSVAVAISVVLVSFVSLSQPAPSSATRDESSCFGAASIAEECGERFAFDGELTPALAELRSDDANRPECWSNSDDGSFELCTLGSREDYSLRLFAVGDSHNNVLVDVYETIARTHGWRIDLAGRSACHWTHAVRVQHSESAADACAAWNEAVDDYVASTQLDAIIVTNSRRADYTDGVDPIDGFISAWRDSTKPETPIIAIVDNAVFPGEALDCLLDDELVAVGACTLPRDEALPEGELREAVSRDSNAYAIDLNDHMCDDDVCSLVVGGVVTSRDGSHLTATYAATLEPYLVQAIDEVLDRYDADYPTG